MSADIAIWNAGACQASVRRRAIVRRTEVSGTRSISPGIAGAGAAGAGAPAAARSTSSATTRPSGPVPLSEPSSMPRSRAIRRASGDALMRAPAPLPCDGGHFTAALALLLARRAGRALLLCRFRDRLCLLGLDGRDVLALLADEGDRGADIGLAFCDGDLEQDAGSFGLDLLRHLVRVELVERLAFLDLITFGLEPLDDRPRLHALAQPGELHLASHARSEPVVGTVPVGDSPSSSCA